MNETHLEQTDEVRQAIEEVSQAVGMLTTVQELRETALQLAIQVYLKPGENRYTDIISLAEGLYKFLSADDDDLDD
jgi:lipoate synthase